MLRQHHVDFTDCFHGRTLKATPEPHRVAGLSLRLMQKHSVTLLLCGVCRMPVPCFVVAQVDLSLLWGERLVLE